MSLLIALIALAQTSHPHSSATLISSMQIVRPGSPFLVGVQMKMDPTWHTYWRNPGDSGIPISVHWHLPKGWEAGESLWPVPEKLVVGGLTNYAYEHHAMLLFKITPPRSAGAGRAVALKADVSWLICQSGCTPANENISCAVSIGKTQMRNESASRLLNSTYDELPPKYNGSATARRTGRSINLTLLDVPSDLLRARGVQFFSADGAIDPSSPQKETGGKHLDTLNLVVSQFAPAKVARLSGLLVSEKGVPWWHGKKAVSVDIPINSN